MRDLSGETMGLTESRGERRDVEITDVQTVIVDGNYPWTLVRVYTDAGVAGNGEAYWGGAIPEIIERLKPFIVGENPLDIDRLYEHMVQKMSGEGSVAGKDIAAISGIELALHDVAGKILDVPAYQLVELSDARVRVRIVGCAVDALARGRFLPNLREGLLCLWEGPPRERFVQAGHPAESNGIGHGSGDQMDISVSDICRAFCTIRAEAANACWYSMRFVISSLRETPSVPSFRAFT
jgi:L-alanine-DL-glutamate epimerase-like enolase superfamily enzyme